ncbi:MAG: GNAT family N-acetyltransferase [Ktedonobacterales bacterium]
MFLETERLMLRRFTASDEDHLFDLDSDPQVMRWITGGASTPREVIQRDILPAFLHSYDRIAGFGVWAAIERASGDFVGWFSFRPPEGSGSENVAFGYRLRRAVWGQGYATEGVRALIHNGFTDLGVQRVFATTYQDNLASRRVMEKAGLTLARTFRMTPADLLAADTFDSASQDLWDGDDVEYALLKADWERQNRQADQRPLLAPDNTGHIQ